MNDSVIVIFMGAVVVVGAVAASILPRIKQSLIALWLTGLGVGGLYLSAGAEVLAIIQWVLGTLLTLSLVFFAVMFGEFPGEASTLDKNGPNQDPSQIQKKGFLLPTLAGLVGVSFFGLIWKAIYFLPEPSGSIGGDTGIRANGRALTEDYLLSLGVLGLSLFLVLIGSGVIARLDRKDELS